VRIGKSVRLALEALREDDLETGMLHACNAFDGTAKRVYPHAGVARRFTDLFQDRARTLEPFAIPWLDLRGTRIAVRFKPESQPKPRDFAEMIYTMHRCHHGHGEEVPFNWQMVKVDGDKRGSFMLRTAESVLIPSTFIEALCAVAIFEPANKDERVGVPLNITAEFVEWAKQDVYMCLFAVDKFWGRQELFDGYRLRGARRLRTLSTPEYESGGTPPPPGSSIKLHMESISSQEDVPLEDLPEPSDFVMEFTPGPLPGWRPTADES
jgi:hypothetical protein